MPVRYPAKSSPPSTADIPNRQSTARRCGKTAYSVPCLSVPWRRPAPEWRSKRERSSCRTRSGWREYPRRCSRTPAAARRKQAQAMPCGSGSCAHLLLPALLAKCAGKLRWPPSRTPTHRKRAVWYRTAADTASSRAHRGQSSHRSTAAENTPVAHFFGRRYPRAARRQTWSAVAAGSQSAPCASSLSLFCPSSQLICRSRKHRTVTHTPSKNAKSPMTM